MADGINLSIKEYRKILIDQMPPWMITKELDLLSYFSLAGYSYLDKLESIVIDDIEYQKDEWTFAELKSELGIVGTGNYDACTIDMIEQIDDEDNVLIYTNPNIIMLDAIAAILQKLDRRRNQFLTETNPWLATVDGLLYFWEAIFQSQRLIINGIPETDSEYMARAITGLFGQSSSLIALRKTLAKYGLTNFTLEDSRKDTFKWNTKSESDSINLYLEAKDYEKISFINQIFFNIALAGKRLFIFCPAPNHDEYCLNFGNSSETNTDYVIPPPFIPGYGTEGAGYGASYGAFYGG